MKTEYIDIETYFDLVKAKHNGSLREKLKELVPEEMNKPEAELYITQLWLRSLHENSELDFDCDEHGHSKIKPNIILNKVDKMEYTLLSGMNLVLKQPPFLTDSIGEQVLKSIDYIKTETENIPFSELSQVELDKLTNAITLDDIKQILKITGEETVYMIYTDCCGETETIIGFDAVLEVM